MLELKDVTFSYPGKEAIFNGLNMKLPPKGDVHLKGPNGCGKTTLLKIMSGLIIPQAGEKLWEEKKLNLEQTNFLSANESGFFDQVTGKEGLELFCQLNGTKLENTLAFNIVQDELFESINTTEFYRMSSGMKRLFMIALCFTKSARLFFLDEPFIGLDRERANALADKLKRISKDCLVVLTSHTEVNAKMTIDLEHILDSRA